MFAKNSLIVNTAILALVVCLGGCAGSNPIFRKLAEKEDAKQMKRTDEEVAKSPELQELDRLCKEIPMFDGFVPKGRFAGPTSTTSLTYFYRSPAAYSRVKAFYVSYFSHNGWTLMRQKENSWGPDELEFKKPTYRIIISHGGLGRPTTQLVATNSLILESRCPTKPCS